MEKWAETMRKYEDSLKEREMSENTIEKYMRDVQGSRENPSTIEKKSQ